MKYAWIREHRDSFPVAALCAALEVSTSGYYDWLDRPPSPRAERHARIQTAVQQVHAESHGIYGSLKIAKQLQECPDLESACRNTVAQAMWELGLKSRVSKSFTPTTTRSDPTKQPAPNELAQDFTAAAPNRKWVTDITYLATAEGWVYLAVALDLFSRKVVGWAVSDSLATELVSETLRQAVESRQPQGRDLLHHSDRGCQYTSDAYQGTRPGISGVNQPPPVSENPGSSRRSARDSNRYDFEIVSRATHAIAHGLRKNRARSYQSSI